MQKFAILILLIFQTSKIAFPHPVENPELQPNDDVGHFMGDIELTEEQFKIMNSNLRVGINFDYFRWPKTGGFVTVPFVIQEASEYSKILSLF